MHELSIADAIVAVAARNARGRRVAVVEVSVGRLRQVVPSALEFAFELCAEGTPVEGAELRVEHVPVRLECGACAWAGGCDDFPLRCARCGRLDVEVVGGEELRVEALELEEEGEPIPAGRR